jgi:hypothetical protein
MTSIGDIRSKPAAARAPVPMRRGSRPTRLPPSAAQGSRQAARSILLIMFSKVGVPPLPRSMAGPRRVQGRAPAHAEINLAWHEIFFVAL